MSPEEDQICSVDGNVVQGQSGHPDTLQSLETANRQLVAMVTWQSPSRQVCSSSGFQSWTQVDSDGLRGTQVDSEGLRWTQVDSGGLRGTQVDSGGLRGTQRDSGGLRWTQGDSGGRGLWSRLRR